MPNQTPCSSGRAIMPDAEWKVLIRQVREGSVVPIIGQELLVPPDPAIGDSYYNVWGQALARRPGAPADVLADGDYLYDVVNRIGLAPGNLAGVLEALMDQQKWAIPVALEQLASIDDFGLYVTTTIDHLMEIALRQKRGGDAVNDIFFYPSPEFRHDLSVIIP